MLIVFRLEVRVDEWLAARGRVSVPRPQGCPACGHERVTFDGWRPRVTRRGRVDVRRVLCGAAWAHVGGQDKTHSLVPDVLVAGRCDLVSVIGWALAAGADGWGHRRIAARLEAHETTVRRWLRRVRRYGQWLAGRLLAVAAAADPAVRGPPAVGPVEVFVGSPHRMRLRQRPCGLVVRGSVTW